MKCPYCEAEIEEPEDLNDHITQEHYEELEECGCCDYYHPKGYLGDCRDDNNRF